MKQIKVAEETKRYSICQEAYNSQSLKKLKSPFLSITNGGIANWEKTIYYKDETLENYLHAVIYPMKICLSFYISFELNYCKSLSDIPIGFCVIYRLFSYIAVIS